MPKKQGLTCRQQGISFSQPTNFQPDKQTNYFGGASI